MSALDELVLSPDSGLKLPRPRVRERLALPGHVSGGRFSILEIVVDPGGLVAPVHVHEHEDEIVYVTAGEVNARLGDEETVATEGSVVFGRRGLPHSFWNPGDRTARLVMVISPANLDDYFAELPEVTGAGKPAEAHLRHAERFGLRLDLDSVDDLARRHGVSLF